MLPIVTELTADTLLITPNRRLARQLKRSYSAAQQQPHWQVPDIIPWEPYLQRCYSDLIVAGHCDSVLLSASQSAYLWQTIICSSPQGSLLLNINDCAKQAQKAWQLMQEWQVSWDALETNSTEDAQQFLHWAKQFEQACNEKHFICSSQLPQLLLNNLEHLPMPGNIIWYGFLEFTPMQQTLYEKVGALGITQHISQPQQAGVTVTQRAYQTLEDELSAMAQWANECHQQNPEHSIACVIPNLTALRSQLSSLFQKTFYPKQLFKTASECQAYNISGGIPLAKMPVIKAVFDLLQLSHWQIPLSLITDLLRCPYIKGAQTEMIARAQLEYDLYAHGEAMITQQRLIELSETSTPIFYELLNDVTQLEIKQQLAPSDMITLIMSCLRACGWPGERVLDSDEYQQMMRLKPLLDDFAGMDGLQASLTWHEAIQQLQQLAIKSIFQVETNDSQVHVLGLLEAAGNSYDKLWLANMHDDIMPSQAQPNPFIPIKLQKQLGLPHCSPGRELEYSEALLQSLLQAAPEIMISYPLQEGDRTLSPSPLLAEFPGAKQLTRTESEPWVQAASLECLSDEKGPAINIGERIKGGTGVLKSQAQCPFQAFARYRLGARAIDELDIGLSHLDRGILVHEVLQCFWEEVKTHEALVQKTHWEPLLTDITQRILKRYQSYYPSIVTDSFAAVEQTRIVTLIQRWLDLEKQRQPFSIVALEQPIKLNIANLALKGQVDRIDQLDTGALILIDYKTGFTRISDWFGERPSEPQLPLYAVQQAHAISGMVFAQVTARGMRFNGVTTEDEQIPQVKALAKLRVKDKAEDWEAQLTQWQQTLEGIAQEFSAGVAAINPKDAIACAYCELPSFCRYHLHEEQD